MGDWEQDKQEFIEKMSKAGQAFDSIFKIDADSLVIQGEEREVLRKLQEENRVMLHKLQSREFTVSIVGLEKAGKSTLGNALIHSMVLPEYAQRCTYTTTEIRSGDSDVAEVYFYSREEFNKNLRRMLSEVKYPGADTVDFSTMTIRAFNDYWQTVKNDPEKEYIYNTHDASTAADLRDILNGKETLAGLIGQAPRKFGSEYWGHNKINEFQTYITGISGTNEDGSVIRKPHPYAVKNVIIRSANLREDMRHMVLYDVPGFDSPTKLHKEQTKEMLKKSDAIILVTNVGSNPDLTSTQLDMLRTAMSAQDNYGISLSEKAFVFGNKIDSANDVQTARSNLATLRRGVIANHIALEPHIVGGSARAYLETEGLLEGNVASRTIDEWQMDSGDGLALLHEKMEHYYDHDRFDVLKKRAENTINKTREVLDVLLDRYNTGEFTVGDASVEIVQDIQGNLPVFDKKANEITTLHINKIGSEHPFTVALQGEIDNIYPLSTAHEQLIKDVEYSLSITPGKTYKASTVDVLVREKLQKKFIENIVATASKLTTSQQRELRQLLVTEFLNIMGSEKAENYREELEKSVNDLFDHMLIEGGKQCSFNSLVERFVSTIVLTVILAPFADRRRFNWIVENLAELVSLSVYYNMPTENVKEDQLNLDNISSDSRKFFATILAHEGCEQDIDASENESILRQFFEDNKEQICQGANLALDLIPVGKWAKLIMKAGINLANIRDDKSIKNRDKLDGNQGKLDTLIYGDAWKNLSADERVKKMENVVQSYSVLARPATGGGINSYLEELHNQAKQAPEIVSKEDMLATLDTDIEILRDITRRSVINAIALERAYTSVVTKNVELIREHLQGDGAREFRAWCRENAPKLMPSRFASIIEAKSMNENRKSIVNTLKNVLDNWTV